MTTVIKTKNSTTTTSAPSSLAQGELAVNITNKKLWVGNAATTPIQLLGAGADLSLSTATLSGNLTLSGGTANGVLYLNGSKVATSGSALVFDGTNFATTGTISGTNHIVTGGTANGNSMYLATTNSIGWSTNGTERMRIDSSGNLGLGVTPSAWDSSYKAARVNNFTIASQDQTGGSELSKNSYVASGGTNTYIATGYATKYEQTNGGVHRWFNAPSGTAGNAITFTQAMTLDASGNLGIGTTGPSYKLDVAGLISSQDAYLITANSSGVPSAGAFIYRPASNTIAFGTASTERMRIGATGLINTSTGTLSPYNNTTGVAANMVVGSNGDLYRSTSSLKYKTNVQDATHGLADVLKLRAVTYKGKAEADAGKTFGGLIAEEVDAVGLKEFVQYAEDGSPDALAYGNMVSLCIKAIQEQQAIITDLKARIETLEAK